MFSGIITSQQKPKRITKTNKSLELTFATPKGRKISEGDSIAVDGVCLTVACKTTKDFRVFLMAETLRRTSFGSVAEDHAFNLEQPLTLNSLIGGHLVQGHVDTTAKVTKIIEEGESRTVWFEIDAKFTKYMIYKGSITVNGVSLTLVDVTRDSFSVSLIPYTLRHTNLGSLKTGDTVNIEVDMIAKYIEKLAKRG